MRTQRIAAEICVCVTPNAMYMVRVAICAVVLDREARRSEPVVVRLRKIRLTDKCEGQLARELRAPLLKLVARDSLVEQSRVRCEELVDELLLRIRHRFAQHTAHVGRLRIRSHSIEDLRWSAFKNLRRLALRVIERVHQIKRHGNSRTAWTEVLGDDARGLTEIPAGEIIEIQLTGAMANL